MGTPDEVAAAVLFLSSESSAFTTGQRPRRRRRLPGPLTGPSMADVIRIDDLARPGPQRRPADGHRVRRVAGRPTLTRRRRLRRRPTARTGLDDFGPDDFAERLGLQLGEMDADDERTGLGRLLMFGDCVALRRQPAPDPRPPAPPSRDPRDPDHPTGHRGRTAPFGHHPPREPLGRRHPVPVDAAVGVLRAGARTPKEPDRGRRGRSALDPLRRRVGGHAGGGAARGGHAPDGAGPRARGDRAAAAGLLELHPRVGGPGAAVARLLPRATTRRRTTPT